MKKIASLFLILACLISNAAEPKLDLRVFDGRASTFLARMEEAGMPVYRLVPVADIRVPKLEAGVAPRAALEQVAKQSGLELHWAGDKPLLCALPSGESLDVSRTEGIRAAGWRKDRRAMASILAMSGFGGAETSRACAEAVLRYGRASGAALLDRKATERLVRAMADDKDWLLRRQAVLAAVDLGLPDAEAIVERAAIGPHSELVRGAALAAGRLGTEKGAAILDGLADPVFIDKRFRKHVQYAVTYGCAEMGGDRAVAILRKLAFGKDAYLAVWALRAAGMIGNETALALLKEAAEHKDPRRSRGAAIGLGHCRAEGTLDVLEKLVMWTTANEGAWVTPPGPAAVALGRHGGDRAVDLLIEAWDKPKHAPKLEILYALGPVGSDKARAFLEKQLKNEDERLQRAAAWALGRGEKTGSSAKSTRRGPWGHGPSRPEAMASPGGTAPALNRSRPRELVHGASPSAPLEVEDLRVAVRMQRPRVFLRARSEPGYHGPSLDRMRENFRRPDYQRAPRKDKLPRSRMGQLVLWLLSGDEFAGLDAAAWACEMQNGGIARARGKSPSYAGISVQRTAAAYDWLYDHGDVDPITRRLVMHHLEGWARNLGGWIRNKNSTVFYSRRWGALAGSGIAALALFGETPTARDVLQQACWHLRSKDGLCTIRQAQDGGTAGSCYGFHHMFTDNANLLAAITYGTDWNVAEFTQKERGDWLQKQLYFQMHCTYPDGNFFKDGDLWSGAAGNSQYRMQVDVITGLYRNGIGRSYADWMAKKWPKYFPSDYHTEFVWQFYVFNDPTVKPRPLSDLPRCMLFSPDIDGYVLWRSSWKPDATVVHFHCGDTIDMHGGADQGKFVIFKHRPLANKNGGYHGYGSPVHRYYRSPLSANTVVFERPGRRGKGVATGQVGYVNRAGGVNSFEEFKKARAPLGPPVGRIVKHEVTEDYARAVGVLDGSTPDKGQEHRWTREIVFLGYESVLVLDRVRTGAQTKAKWLLNFEREPQIEDSLIRFDNGKGRLFCRTLLPEKPIFKKVGGDGAPEVMGKQWCVEVTGPDPGAREQVFLHVLYPTDTGTDAMPACSMERKGDEIVVRVGERAYTFCCDPPVRGCHGPGATSAGRGGGSDL